MEPTPNLPAIRALRPAWNKGRIVGQKRPLKPKHVWAIRVRLELAENHRDLALFNMAIDSKLRGCDLVKMKVVDVMASGQIKERASVLQSKTQKPVRFEISEGTRASVEKWMEDEVMIGSEYLWPGRFHERLHISTRQYARDCPGLGHINRPRSKRLRDPFDAADQSHADLQEDRQSTRCSVAAWAYQNGQYGPLPRR